MPVIRALGRLKAAAPRTNADLGKLDSELAERIAAAGDAIAAGERDNQFPRRRLPDGLRNLLDVNANEVIAELAGEEAHRNDHVNMGQSSNDVFPSAVHIAALGEVNDDLLPAMEGLTKTLSCQGEAEFDDIVKTGRTHLMDAVPVTLGQEFAGYAAQIEPRR